MTWKRTIILVILMSLTFGITQLSGRTKDVPLNRSFDTFPERIGDWQGVKGELDAEIFNILGVEDYILANYRRDKSPFVNLYIGFYQSQREGDLIHSPKNCMPGAGWRIVRTETETIPHHATGVPFNVIKLALERGPEKQVVLYWFQSRGRIIASEYMQKIWLVLDAVFRNRTDGSFVRLISPVVTDEQDTVNLIKDFAVQVQPFLDAFIPS